WEADAILLVTRWPEFGDLPRLLAARCRNPPLLIDGRRLVDPHAVSRYRGIGLRERAWQERAALLRATLGARRHACTNRQARRDRIISSRPAASPDRRQAVVQSPFT